VNAGAGGGGLTNLSSAEIYTSARPSNEVTIGVQ